MSEDELKQALIELRKYKEDIEVLSQRLHVVSWNRDKRLTPEERRAKYDK